MSDEKNELSPAKREEEEGSEEAVNEESEEDRSMETEEEQKDEKPDDEEKKEEVEEEDESEDDEEPEKKGIYDKPLVLEVGRKRERKKVERLSFQTQPQEEKKFEILEGKGDRLGDMPFGNLCLIKSVQENGISIPYEFQEDFFIVEFKLTKHKAEDLKPLHRILFRGRAVSHLEVKKHIRLFSGFPFSKDDDEYEKREQLLKSKSFTMAMIKQVCEVLDVQRGGTKDELVERLLDFLMKPKDSGRKVPKPKRKRKSKGEGDTAKKSRKKKEKKEKKVKSQKKVESDDEEEEEAEEEEDEEASEEEEESEEEVTPPPKKRKVSEPKKKAEKKKQEKKTTEKKKAAPKKTEKKQKKKKAAVVESDDEDDLSSSSDEDEPLVKQKKEGPPSNDELKDVIKKLLDNANLEEVTMKTILKDVYAKYPKYDLSERKDFIKNTVKQIIS